MSRNHWLRGFEALMNGIRLWPHLTIIALLGALLGGAAVALWQRHEITAQAHALPSAARAPIELFEVPTPLGAVDFNQPGLYQVGINDNGNTVISVLSGLAQVVGLGGSGQISRGEVLTLVGQAASDVVLSRLNPNYAG